MMNLDSYLGKIRWLIFLFFGLVLQFGCLYSHVRGLLLVILIVSFRPLSMTMKLVLERKKAFLVFSAKFLASNPRN